ncbi:MAG: HAD family hydrolase [Ignavibacteriales bacterium]
MLFGEKRVEVRAVIYDKDGTLFNGYVLWQRLEAERFKRLREAGVTPEAMAWVSRTVGIDPETGAIDRTGPMALATAADEVMVTATGLYLAGYQWPEARRIALEVYRETERELDVSTMTVLCEGVKQSLRSLRACGVSLGVVTTDTRERSRRMLEHAGILGFMDVITGAEDYSAPKPDPEPILKACATLGMPAGDCAYVGDSPSDMMAATSAGVRLRVGVLTGIGEEAVLRGMSDVVLPSAACILPAAGG